MRVALALVLVLLSAPCALAEPAGPRAPDDLALGLRLGDGTLRLNGRLVTPDGFWSLWLDGAWRERGLTVQGRAQRDGRALNFSLDAVPGASGRLRWWQDPL